jgi:hypothetical protein
MAEIVPAGPYLGFSYAQLLTELESLGAQRRQTSALIASYLNNGSFQREGSETQLRRITQSMQQVHEAMRYLRPDLWAAAPSSRSSVTFSAET